MLNPCTTLQVKQPQFSQLLHLIKTSGDQPKTTPTTSPYHAPHADSHEVKLLDSSDLIVILLPRQVHVRNTATLWEEHAATDSRTPLRRKQSVPIVGMKKLIMDAPETLTRGTQDNSKRTRNNNLEKWIHQVTSVYGDLKETKIFACEASSPQALTACRRNLPSSALSHTFRYEN